MNILRNFLLLGILAILVVIAWNNPKPDMSAYVRNIGKIPVCHAMTEDSVITDCDYHNGAWWKK
jgi:hypothetical protein